MLKKIATFVNTYFLSVCLLVTLGVAGYDLLKSHKRESITKLNYSKIQKIKPEIIIDQYSLRSDEGGQSAVMPFFGKVNAMGPFAVLMRGAKINVLIDSQGGLVSVGEKIISSLLMAKNQLGISFTCHVQNAMSMAFTIMVKVCDERILLKDGVLMQHSIAYGGAITTASTMAQTISLSNQEARVLGVKPQEWLALTRDDSKGDKYFSKDEMKKYKLIHSFE